MEDKQNNYITDLHKQCITHCKDLGISKSIINLFFQLQERINEQDNKEA